MNPASLGFWTLASPGFSSSVAVDLSFGYLIVPGTLRILKYQDISDTNGVPPAVTITSPVSASPLIQGQTVSFTANATDDVAVVSVSFFVNGQLVSTTSSQPYRASYTVPLSATTLTFGATAVDFGNNVGTAANVTVPVIPDPLTSVTGRVVNGSGNPVAGATVIALNAPTTSGANGTFTISGLPTIQGPIIVTAQTVLNGVPLFGVSPALPPVLGGITNAGDIRILPVPSITSISPKSFLAGVPVTLAVTGLNLAGASFSFLPTGVLTVTTASINAAGTSATLTMSTNSNALGRLTLIGMNPTGSSDPTPILGFLPGAAFNTVTIPGSGANADPDADGLTNAQEIAGGTDPLNADTDADGWPDGLEAFYKSDALNPLSIPNPRFPNAWVSSSLMSLLNSANPAGGIKGPQYVSGPIFTILNAQNPSTGIPGSKQYVSSPLFSILNTLNPSIGSTGSTRYVSSLLFSVLNIQNPSAGSTGSKQYVSGPIFSLLNTLSPSTGATGSKQYVSGPIFSIANRVSPAPATPSLQFVNSLIFSVRNGTVASPAALLAGLLSNSTLSERTARPWAFRSSVIDPLDSDGDGIPDEEESRLGTSRFVSDTDGDGYPDGLEIALGSNPIDPASVPSINPPGFVVTPVFTIQNNLFQAMKIRPVLPAELRRR